MFRLILLVLVIVGVGAVGAKHFHVLSKLPTSLSFLKAGSSAVAPATKSIDELTLSNTASGEAKPVPVVDIPAPAGKVAGISTEKLDGIGKSISQNGSGIASAISSLINTDSKDPQVSIDVQHISDQIGAQMEKLPAAIVDRAKIAYCQQVLQEATKSATSH